MQFSFWSAFQTFNSSRIFQMARVQFDFMAVWMEPTLSFCTLERQIVVGACGLVYKDYFSNLACFEI